MNASRSNVVTPDLSLLLACKQAHIEAKPCLNQAPITVTTYGGWADHRNFPRHVMERVHDLTLHDDTCRRLRESSCAFRFNFLNRSICTNLQVMRRRAGTIPIDTERDLSFRIEDGLLRYIAMTPPIPGESTADVAAKPGAVDLLDLVLSGQPGWMSAHFRHPFVTQLFRDMVKERDQFIKSRSLTMKTTYKFIVESYKFEKQEAACSKLPTPFFRRRGRSYCHLGQEWETNRRTPGLDLQDAMEDRARENTPLHCSPTTQYEYLFLRQTERFAP